MKLDHLIIHSLHRFHEFELKLVYPIGHSNAGKPLKKICFIGQSGTGKTTLLNLIKDIFSYGIVSDKMNPNAAFYGLLVSGDSFSEVGHWGKNFKNEDKSYTTRKAELVKRELVDQYNGKPCYISFSAESNIKINEIFPEKNNKNPFVSENLDSPFIDDTFNRFDLNEKDIRYVWTKISKEIEQFRIKQFQMSTEITKKLSNTGVNIQALQENLENWKKENPNPIDSLSKKLNIILNEFDLEMPSEFEFTEALDLRFIQVNKKGTNQKVPYEGWSTGTKQLVLTATPLFQLDTSRSIILMDEPERSFFPDIQYKLIDFYSQLAPDAQFFYATHSPIIASAFEPWEIVELEFDEKGNIRRKPYYEGENHVDNYRLNPQYLRWDQILTEFFDVPAEGNPLREGIIQQLVTLRNRLKYLKEQGQTETDEYRTKWQKYTNLAAMAGWNTNDWKNA